MAFKLPELPYAYDALEPVIDKQTMEIHHQKHHGAYVNNLNTAIQGKAEWESKTVDQLVADLNKVPAEVRNAVRNNGGGHWNHSFFWQIMAPKGRGGGGAPQGELARQIDADLGGLAKMKEDVNKAGVGRFGSGWAWVIVNAQGKLEIVSTPNQDNPLMMGVAEKTGTPILGIDVWEHAYYLKYQNRRADYLNAWWDLINWPKVAEHFSHAAKK
ncbi:MAG: superoxide dismutase [Thermoplasmatota archaeon]